MMPSLDISQGEADTVLEVLDETLAFVEKRGV
jgi:hypothetical protein